MQYEYGFLEHVGDMSYKFVVTNADDVKFNFRVRLHIFDELGKQSWEMCGAVSEKLIWFKRPIHSCLNNCPNDDPFRQERIEGLEDSSKNAVELLERTLSLFREVKNESLTIREYVEKRDNLHQDIADHLQIAEAKRAMAEN